MKMHQLGILLLAVCSTHFCANAQNVGIGTSVPIYKLDVVGRTRLQAGTVNNALTSAGMWLTDYRDNSDLVFMGMADSVNYGFWGNKPGVGWQFYFDARYGNVGIGRKPSSGTSRLVLDHPGGASLDVYANGAFRGGFQATDSTLEINGASASSLCFPAPCSPPPAKNIIIWPVAPCTNPPCLNLFNPGRVGMYTTAPNARLHVVAGTGTTGVLIGGISTTPATGYMLNVDGKIICEELKVQLNTAWPDYVFEKEYSLSNLTQLENQVMEQKHLPGIPSAASVASQQGIEIGDMQKRLLEKVEELYRYVFQLNNENIALKKEMQELKKPTLHQ